MAFLYVIDGSNVSRAGSSQAVDLRALYAILAQILKNGDNFMCLFDANFPYLVSDFLRPKVRALSKKYPNHFYFVASQTRADDSILGYVDAMLQNPAKYGEQEIRIISRDTFASEKEYAEQYAWLANIRIPVNRVQDVIIINHPSLKVNIVLDPKKKVSAYADELFALLPESKIKPKSQPKPTKLTPAESPKVPEIGELVQPSIMPLPMQEATTQLEAETPSRSDVFFAKLREATHNPDRFRDKYLLDN